MKTDFHVPSASTLGKAVIRLESLRFDACHGVLPQERTVGGHYTVDVVLELQADDIYPAIAEDRLESTVNYAEVYDVIRREMQQPCQLLEHLCGRLLQGILVAFPVVRAASVSVRKDVPPIPGIDCDGCSVTLSAERPSVAEEVNR